MSYDTPSVEAVAAVKEEVLDIDEEEEHVVCQPSQVTSLFDIHVEETNEEPPLDLRSLGKETQSLVAKLTNFVRSRSVSDERFNSIMGDFAAVDALLKISQESCESTAYDQVIKERGEVPADLFGDEYAAIVSAKFLISVHDKIQESDTVIRTPYKRGEALICEDCAQPFSKYNGLLTHKVKRGSCYFKIYSSTYTLGHEDSKNFDFLASMDIF